MEVGVHWGPTSQQPLDPWVPLPWKAIPTTKPSVEPPWKGIQAPITKTWEAIETGEKGQRKEKTELGQCNMVGEATGTLSGLHQTKISSCCAYAISNE